MKIEIVGGWGGFPPIKIKFIENWNENESENEMTMKIEMSGGWGGFPPIKTKFIENWNENDESENKM